MLMLVLVYCRYGSRELITVKPIKQTLTLYKMYDKLSSGSTLILFCFYNIVGALFL